MWADSKIVGTLKIGSIIQKLLNFEKKNAFYIILLEMAAIVTVQNSISFEPM